MTVRADLLALTLDDLRVLSNRGLVKRAQKELAAGTLSYEMTEAAGVLQFAWSDEVVCRLPMDEVVCDRHCTCTATVLCRHLIRSVLAYQAKYSENADLSKGTDSTDAGSAVETTTIHPAQPPLTWNPGEISDEALATHFRTAQLNKLKKEFSVGQVIEVTCSYKPTAQLHTFPHTLRFLVPHDFRYTYCDCNYESPCPHVPLAIWAFRQLPTNHLSGIVTTEEKTLSTPTALLDDIDSVLRDLLTAGLQGISPGLMAKLDQLLQQCDGAHLLWPANVLKDLIQTLNFYRSRDARFSPQQVTSLIAELCMRCDAICADTGESPQLFLRGPRLKRVTDLGAARLIGLGCEAKIQHKHFTLSTYFQDTSSGKVLALSSPLTSIPSAEAEPNYSFWQTAQTNALKQTAWTTLGSGQLLIKRGTCTPDDRLQLKRNQSVVANPQRFEWEKLRSPVLVDDLMELQQRLQALPPNALRPRRLTDSLYVMAVSQIESVAFDSLEQATTATVEDAYGNRANLFFPYTTQAHDGTEALLFCLSRRPVRFISARVSIRAGQIQLIPIAVVFEFKDRRQVLQPWIHSKSHAVEALAFTAQEQIDQSVFPQDHISPIQCYLEMLAQLMADLAVNGLAADNTSNASAIEKMALQGKALGFEDISRLLTQLASPQISLSHRLSVYFQCLVLLETIQQL